MMAEKQGGKTQISPTSPEFAYLEYNLQLTLHSSTAKIVSAFAISNPHLGNQFERRCKASYALLRAGNWHDGVKGQGGDSAKNLRKAIFCRIGVGRAYVSSEAGLDKRAIPDGYDSFYIHDDDQSNSNSVTSEGYYHEYYLKSSAQVLPQYLIHYDYDARREVASREKSKCDNCEKEAAVVYCQSDAANLCQDCDAQLHVSKLASRHVRTLIGKGADVFGHCRHHPEKKIEFFCSQCHVPVCVYCKMVGNHANGEAAKHQLVSVSEAYHTVLEEAQAHDPILHARRSEITNQIACINARARAVEKMACVIEGQIEEIYKKAMLELKTAAQNKLNVLLGDEVELKRQFGEIAMLEEFLKYQQSGEATQFLFSWVRHQQLRSELHDFKFFREDIDVALDLKVVGGITIATEESFNSTPGPHSPAVPSGSPSKWAKSNANLSPVKDDFFAETLGTFDQLSMNIAPSAEDLGYGGYDDASSVNDE
ncbi:uncharacterized protein BJ171DRAFT_622590 [Polychytrium aggregatum]|uniref:uncharacterized protein n=1 Tax=Polychytrium aggregatum TaxID=110093 RepID=UPI0022FDC7FD|nr:uncharacterized protein BJ171DRAFT_622590 [Polychytrium aggregatum]KAI9203809.1 hypothetical protein BJ171DRAFT_622590 [Polychytrium aggregatum]